jgi:hypothetical protein
MVEGERSAQREALPVLHQDHSAPRAIKCPNCSEIVNVDAYVALEAQRATAIKEAKDAARSAA